VAFKKPISAVVPFGIPANQGFDVPGTSRVTVAADVSASEED